MTFPLRQRGSILCGTRFTKSGQEPECGFERYYILIEYGLKAAMLSGDENETCKIPGVVGKLLIIMQL